MKRFNDNTKYSIHFSFFGPVIFVGLIVAKGGKDKKKYSLAGIVEGMVLIGLIEIHLLFASDTKFKVLKVFTI